MYWDSFGDDREFDVPGYPVEGGRDGAGASASKVNPLDVNLRARLATARVRLGDFEEAKVSKITSIVCFLPSFGASDVILQTKMHLSIMSSFDLVEYSVLFSDLADTYFEMKLYGDALPLYIELGTLIEVS